MAKTLLNAFFSFVIGLISPVLGWISSGLLNLLPSSAIDSILSPIASLLNYLKQFAPFALSYLGLNSSYISIIIIIIIASLSIPLLVHAVKLALRWYRILMP